MHLHPLNTSQYSRVAMKLDSTLTLLAKYLELKIKLMEQKIDQKQ